MNYDIVECQKIVEKPEELNFTVLFPEPAGPTTLLEKSEGHLDCELSC